MSARKLTTAEIMGVTDPKAMFVLLLQGGFWPIAIRPRGEVYRAFKDTEDRVAEGKEPIGVAWGAERWTQEKANLEFHRHRGAGVGICLGPCRAPDGRWLIDVEGDGPEAEESRDKLFGGEIIDTLGWGSARGGHRLLIVDGDRLLDLVPKLKGLEVKGCKVPGTYKSPLLPGLELRLGGYTAKGTVKQAQSVVPPTPGTDGKPRQWSGPVTIAEAPEAFYRNLELLAPKPTEKPRKPRSSKPSFVIQAEDSDEEIIAKWLGKYCQKALADEAGEVAGTPEGSRHDRLRHASMNLAGLVATGHLSEGDYRDYFERAGAGCGLPAGEIEDLIVGALAKAEPRDMTQAREWAMEKLAEFRSEGQRQAGAKRATANNSGGAGVPPPGVRAYYGDEEDSSPEDDRPRIICGFEDKSEGLKTWTPQAVDALSRANRRSLTVFQRDKKLVRLSMPVEDDQQPTIENLSPPALLGILDRAAFWGRVQNTRKGPVINYGPPPGVIVGDVMSLPDHDPEDFPPLESIVESPVFGADGQLILEPGYHRSARMFYSPSPDLRGIEIPDRPTPGDVGDALKLIFHDLLVDFPFRDQASKANALAVMLLPFVRLMISGPTPNHHFTASTEGTGKGLCAAACAFPFLGREIEVNVQKESEAEWRKAITSFLMSGASHFFIDNMYNALGWDNVPLDVDSGTLAAAWTGGRWKDRILGGQDEARVKLHAVFMSSGNNVVFSRELTRRLVNIELVPASENPSLRTGFKHDPIMEWARENRASLARACLIICRNWIAKGKKPGGATMGSYESYARTMSGILESAGVVGFLGNRPKPGAGKDRESVRWPALVEAWYASRGEMATSTGQVYDIVFGVGPEGIKGLEGYDPGMPGIPELAVMFADVVGDGKELSRKQKFGLAIGKQDGRVWANKRVVRTSLKQRNGTSLYKLADPADQVEDDRVCVDVWPEGRE